MKRSENVPFDTDESTDGDESEDDDDHTSGYNSGSDDIDLSVLANLTIRDVCDLFALSVIRQTYCAIHTVRYLRVPPI